MLGEVVLPAELRIRMPEAERCQTEALAKVRFPVIWSRVLLLTT